MSQANREETFSNYHMYAYTVYVYFFNEVMRVLDFLVRVSS